MPRACARLTRACAGPFSTNTFKTNSYMDTEKIKKIWSAVKTIIEVIIGFLCGTQIDSWLGGPLM